MVLNVLTDVLVADVLLQEHMQETPLAALCHERKSHHSWSGMQDRCRNPQTTSSLAILVAGD